MTPLITAFAKFVAALGTAVMAFRTWRKEADKAKAEKEKQQNEQQ